MEAEFFGHQISPNRNRTKIKIINYSIKLKINFKSHFWDSEIGFVGIVWGEMCNRVLLPSICACSVWFPLWVPLTYSCFVLTVPHSRSSSLRYHRSFCYVAVIVYKVAMRLVRGIFLFFTLFISFIFYFVLISSPSLLYFICFSLLLLMIDLVGMCWCRYDVTWILDFKYDGPLHGKKEAN